MRKMYLIFEDDVAELLDKEKKEMVKEFEQKITWERFIIQKCLT